MTSARAVAGHRPLVALLVCLCASGVALATARDGDVSLHHEVHLRRADNAEEDGEELAVKVDAEMGSFVKRFLRHGEEAFPTYKEMTNMATRKVDAKTAAVMLQGKLPSEVASMVQQRLGGKSHQPFSEDSLAKALKYLNLMMEGAWKELDDKVIECKEFEDRMRSRMDQVKTDVARLGQQVADLERIRAECIESINSYEGEIIAVNARMRNVKQSYMQVYLQNKMTMTVRRNDLAVFQFMMILTKCKKAAALAQLGPSSRVNLCESEGGLTFDFGDRQAQAKLERMMTPSARAAVREVIGKMEMARAMNGAALLQQAARAPQSDDDDNKDDDRDAGDLMVRSVALSSLGIKANSTDDGSQAAVEDPPKTTTTTPGLPTPPVPKVKVTKRLDITVGGRKCPNTVPDCGLLHDHMSLMWGKFKDLVDELQAEMDKNLFEYEGLLENLNQQLDVLRSTKATFIIKLNEATGSINADREEGAEKEGELEKLMKEYKQYMARCAKRIKWIVFQDFCGYFTVRAQVMEFSKVSPPDKIVDCDLTPFVPDECSVPCDDTCPHKSNPYACGGWQTLTREVTQAPNEFGVRCPPFDRKRKCNQYKCPVDCRMSKWSGWSKCSRECEGGVQGHTRSVIVKAKNGGKACNTAQESRPCNSGSCDRDCRLKKWSTWSPCSVACGGGFQERWRRVLIPIRGDGKCPKGKSKGRYGIRNCNEHECRGDEVCVAKQDLVIAIDTSGSLREKGFNILRDFAASLTDKYMGEYYGYEDMKVGVVQFGNGEIMEDGSIASAILLHPISGDMSKAKKAIEGMVYQKGFTNMAQAFTVAEKMFLLGGRTKAMSAVLTLTDGKPSFLFQTYEKVMQLKDKHTKLFFSPVTEFAGAELKLMKKWASRPWETNLVHVPGMAVLKSDGAIFRQKMLVKYCPEAISPSAVETEEVEQGYMLIRENGHCGKRGAQLSTTVEGAADCAALTQGAGAKAFSLGTHYARGRCYAEDLAVTDSMIADFEKNRAKPMCPGGEWELDELYDFYVMMPLAVI